MVRHGKIFINTTVVIFGRTFGECLALAASGCHTAIVRDLSDGRG